MVYGREIIQGGHVTLNFAVHVAQAMPISFSNDKFIPIAVTSYDVGGGKTMTVQTHPYSNMGGHFALKIDGTGGQVNRDYYWVAFGK